MLSVCCWGAACRCVSVRTYRLLCSATRGSRPSARGSTGGAPGAFEQLGVARSSWRPPQVSRERRRGRPRPASMHRLRVQLVAGILRNRHVKKSPYKFSDFRIRKCLSCTFFRIRECLHQEKVQEARLPNWQVKEPSLAHREGSQLPQRGAPPRPPSVRTQNGSMAMRAGRHS